MKIVKGEIEIYINRNLEEGSYIFDIYGANIFIKNKVNDNKESSGFNDILLFKCKNKNNDRFLKRSIFVNLGSILANKKNNTVKHEIVPPLKNFDLL